MTSLVLMFPWLQTILGVLTLSHWCRVAYLFEFHQNCSWNTHLRLSQFLNRHNSGLLEQNWQKIMFRTKKIHADWGRLVLILKWITKETNPTTSERSLVCLSSSWTEYAHVQLLTIKLLLLNRQYLCRLIKKVLDSSASMLLKLLLDHCKGMISSGFKRITIHNQFLPILEKT